MSDQLSKLAGLIARSKCNTAFLETLLVRERLNIAINTPEKQFKGRTVAQLSKDVREAEDRYRNMVVEAGTESLIDPPNRQPKAIREISHVYALPDGDWREDAIGSCGFGCKIYRNTKTDERVLAHSSAYGCRK